MSFYTALTGLNAFKTQIATIADNVANQETTAYKSQSLTFSEILAESSSSTMSTTGSGVTVVGSSTNWDQGDLTSTGSDADLAITGSGFFVVKDESTGVSYYTRNGAFSYDDEGNLITSTGEVLQGYAINDDGSQGLLTDITLSSQETIDPVATTEITTDINLDSSTDTSGTYSVTVKTYDADGTQIAVTVTFTKTAENEWTWTAGIDSSYGTTSSTGTMSFNSDGTLSSSTGNTITLDLTASGGGTQSIAWNLTDSTITQYSSDSTLSDQSQDGNAMGTLENVAIDEDGVVTGTYSNGQSKALYQIALATFTNSDGLTQLDNGLYAATSDSGIANLGVAGSDGYGSLTCGVLETSNVDLATEMSTLVIAQRAYQACAKLITAEDEMLQTTIQMT